MLFSQFTSQNLLPAGTYAIKVGKGGDAVQSDSGTGQKLGNTGQSSEFQGTIVYGGGGGGDYRYHDGLSGGSGGGGGFQTANGGIVLSPQYGTILTAQNSTYYGNVGESVSASSKSGDGGSANYTSDISGVNYTYSTGGTGRTNGDNHTNDDGTNYGDGGGGGGWSNTLFSGKGSDGIVIIRYRTKTETSVYSTGTLRYDGEEWIVRETSITDIVDLPDTDTGAGLLKYDGSSWVFDTNTYAQTSSLSAYALSSSLSSYALSSSIPSDFYSQTHINNNYYTRDTFLQHLSPYFQSQLVIAGQGYNWTQRFKIYTPNKFTAGGRPANQYRYLVSASPDRNHDVSLHFIHFLVFYNEIGSVVSSRFKVKVLDTSNAAHWTVGFYDRDSFYIEFEGPDKFDLLNVNIR